MLSLLFSLLLLTLFLSCGGDGTNDGFNVSSDEPETALLSLRLESADIAFSFDRDSLLAISASKFFRSSPSLELPPLLSVRLVNRHVSNDRCDPHDVTLLPAPGGEIAKEKAAQCVLIL